MPKPPMGPPPRDPAPPREPPPPEARGHRALAVLAPWGLWWGFVELDGVWWGLVGKLVELIEPYRA